MRRILLFASVFILIAVSCKKETTNPYEVYIKQPPVVINPADTINPNTIVGLHYNIFKPTCANSGCHDGTFEPDYRTVESTYNTLVLQPVIKNDPNNTYKYRVLPGNADMSVLYQRLIKDIDGMSGLMPLSVDPSSDWNTKKSQYIQNIKTWINNGAKDQTGNGPASGNTSPSFAGVMAIANGQNITRGGTGNNLRVPFGTTTFTVYFAFEDDVTASASLTNNKLKIGKNIDSFTDAIEKDLTIITPISGPGYNGTNVDYTHSVTLNIADFPVNEIQYLRVYVKDSNPNVTEIPTTDGAFYVKSYFSFVRQ